MSESLRKLEEKYRERAKPKQTRSFRPRFPLWELTKDRIVEVIQRRPFTTLYAKALQRKYDLQPSKPKHKGKIDYVS